MVWPWLEIEPGTSRTRCQHSTYRGAGDQLVKHGRISGIFMQGGKPYGERSLNWVHIRVAVTILVCVYNLLLYFIGEVERVVTTGMLQEPCINLQRKRRRRKLFRYKSIFFRVRLLSVLHGHSFFHPRNNGHWPPTSKDFLSQIEIEKEPVFSLLNVQC